MKCPDCTNELEKTFEWYYWCSECKTGWLILNKVQVEMQVKAIDKAGFFTDEKLIALAEKINRKIIDETTGEKGI